MTKFVCVVKDRSEVYIRTLRGAKVGRLIYFINLEFDGFGARGFFFFLGWLGGGGVVGNGER